MKAPKTIRGLMFFVAIIGIALGLIINAAPFLQLFVLAAIVMSPQIIIVAICVSLSIREERKQALRDSPDSATRR
jgi:hypothetical protein